MSSVRIASIEEPMASQATMARGVATLVARGEVMGFLPPGTDTSVLNSGLFEAVLSGLAGRGVAARHLLDGLDGADGLGVMVEKALEQSEHSPMPDGEWPSLAGTLGEELLARLLGVSASSLRRYTAGARPTPQDVASRLHILALLVADLGGGYNDFGIRRWFVRPRAQLGGRTPADLLAKGWDPEGSDAGQLRALAAGLLGAGAG